MKVLFVISSLNTGGAQRALSNIVCNLPGDWEIDILLNNAENIVYPYKGRLIDLGIREPSNRESVLYIFKVLVKRFFKLRRLKKTGCYNACVSFLESANIANIITGKKYCKTIISVRNYISLNRKLFYRITAKAFKFIYNHAGHVTAVSKGVKNDLSNNLGMRDDIISVVYNGYPLEQIRQKAGERIKSRSFTFVTMGRYHQAKGQWHLIRVFAEFLKTHENCRLVIIGDGPYTEYFSRLIASYKLKKNVILTGFIDNPYQELVNADAFIFPSLYEGFPNALLEAMICGLPVIASDFRSGAREILAPDTDINYELMSEFELAEYGILTPVCSGTRHPAEALLEPQESFLLDAMGLLYTDNDIRNRYIAASKKRAGDFSIEKCADEWRRLIEAQAI